jgi:hypothetical protein
LKTHRIIFGLFLILAFQQINAQKFLNKDSLSNHLSELRENFGKNKKYPQQFELACLVSLSYFPELKDVQLEFKYRNIGRHSMAAQPDFDFLLEKHNERGYIILINQKSLKTLGYSIEALTLNQMVGIFGHELSHICQYKMRKNFSLSILLINYLNVSFSQKFEFEADIIAIKHGLGWQVYDFANYILNNANLNKIYKNKKLRDYYSEKDILEFLK